MRFITISLTLLASSLVSASWYESSGLSTHQAAPAHRIQKRGINQRRQAAAAVAIIAITGTAPPAPSSTVAAMGTIKGDTTPLTCLSRADIGGSCDPSTNGGCCVQGSKCVANVCLAICKITTLEAYCDASEPCDASLGYLCTANRCTPPGTASRVAVGAACDQGSGNTLFCLPSKAMCVNSVCAACTQ